MVNKLDELPKVLKGFYDYLNLYNYSERTISVYMVCLYEFFKFIKEYYNIEKEIKDFTEYDLLNIRKSDVYTYMVYLNMHNNNCAKTRSRKLASISSFYKWLYKIFPYAEKSITSLHTPKKVMRLPKYLNIKQGKEIQEVFTIKNCKHSKRNNAIISLFLNTGMRLSELYNININDIDFKLKKIIILRKGNKQRFVYFGDSCKNKIIEYLHTRFNDDEYLKSKEPLFLSQLNKRLSKETIESICKKAFELINADKTFSTHTLRHTAATAVYKTSKDILLVKEFLGHKSISSTEIYIHTTNEELKKAVERNPLNKYKILK